MQGLKEALLSLIGKGGLKIELPDASIQDAFRRNRGVFTEEIKMLLRNGAFPLERVTEVMGDHKDNWLAELIKGCRDYIDEQRILKIAIELPGGQRIDTGIQHEQFPELLDVLYAGQNPYMAGGAGSGKTTAAEQAARALNRTFRYTGAITSEFKLTGFIDARGQLVRTAFREVYEKGGLFLFDEIDASMPAPVLAFNTAIANGYMDFPDAQVERHKDFLCVAAANTFGAGANATYIGRNKLDGASLNRFTFIHWQYDDELELTLARQAAGDYAPSIVRQWVAHVQKVRNVVSDLEIPHVISPRDSVAGVQLLRIGRSWEQVEQMRLWKGLDDDSINTIREALADEA